MTQEQLDAINSWTLLAPKPPTPAADLPTPSGGILSRIGQQAANLPSNIGNSLWDSLLGISGFINPEVNQYKEEAPHLPQFYDIAAPTTTGESVVDFLGGGVAPELAAALIPYGAVSKLGKAAKIPAVLREMLAQSSAGFSSGAKESGEQAILGGAIGALSGGLEKFSRAGRLLPAAGLAGGEFIGQQTLADQTPEQAGISSVVDFLANMLPGKIGGHLDLPPLRELPFELMDRQPQLALEGYRPEVPEGVIPAGYTKQAQEALPPIPEQLLLEGAPLFDPNGAIRTPYSKIPAKMTYETPQANQPALFNLNEYPITREAALVNPPSIPESNSLQQLDFRDAELERLFFPEHYRQPNLERRGVLQDIQGQNLLFPEQISFPPEGRTLTSILVEPAARQIREDANQLDLLSYKHPEPPAPVTSSPPVEPPKVPSNIEKLARSQTMTHEDLSHELVHYEPHELEAIGQAIGSESRNHKVLAKELKEIYSPIKFKTNIKKILKDDLNFKGEEAELDRVVDMLRNSTGEEGSAMLKMLFSTSAGGIAGLEDYRENQDPIRALLVGAATFGGSTLAMKLLRNKSDVIHGRKIGQPEPVLDKVYKSFTGETPNRAMKLGQEAGSIPAGGTLSKKSFNDIAREGNAKFDAYDPLTGKNQFTLLDNKSTIYIKPDATEAEIHAKFRETRDKFLNAESEESVQSVVDTLKSAGLPPEDFLSPSQLATWQKMQGMSPNTMKLGGDVGGFIAKETLATLVGAGSGGLYGFAESDGQPSSALGWAMVGAGIGLAGSKAIKALVEGSGTPIKTPISPKVPNEEFSSRVGNFIKKTFYTPGGDAVYGLAGLWSNVVRGAESWMNLNQPIMSKIANIKAKGLIADITGKLQTTIDSVSHLKPSQPFIENASKFLKGQLVPQVESEAILKKGGSLTQEEFSKLDATAKKASGLTEKWVVKKDATDTNTSGEDITVYRTTKATKDKLAAMQKQRLLASASSPVEREWARMPIHARESINALQDIVISALPQNSKQLNKLLGTLDQYQTRTFAIHSDPNFRPTEQVILDRMAEIGKNAEDNYLSKILTVDKPKAGYTMVRPGVFIEEAAVKGFKDASHPTLLRQDVERELMNQKRDKELFKSPTGSSDMDASVMERRRLLTPAQRRLYGEHVNATEEIVHTINRMSPIAKAAEMINHLVDVKTKSGLKMAYDDAEFIAQQTALENQLRSTDPALVREAQLKLRELKNYIATKDDPRIGVFENKRISRFAYDQLKDHRSPWGIFENPVGHSLTTINNWVKQANTVYSPVTQVRQIWTTPVLLAAGRAGDPGALRTAFEVLTKKNHPRRSELTRLGLLSADQVHGELNHTFDQLINGESDGAILKAIKKAHKKVGNIYAGPDQFVKLSTYLSAEKRFTKWRDQGKDGFAGLSDLQIKDEALKFTDRRTMDYGNVPQAVKIARQLPFVNMYVSFTYEIARIMKNMVEDAFKGDMHAASVVGGIIGLPFIVQQMAESNLTPEQKKQWDKANRLSPDYSRTRFKAPTGQVDAQGNIKYRDFTPLNVIDNYEQMARALARGDMESFMAVNPWVGWENTPIFNIFTEQISGRSLRTKQEFRSWNDRLQTVAQEILPGVTPGIGYEAQRSTPVSLGGMLGTTNTRTGRSESVEGLLTRWLTGVNTTTVNPATTHRSAWMELQEDIRAEQAYFNRINSTQGIPEDRKARIRKNTEESIKVLLNDFANRVGA